MHRIEVKLIGSNTPECVIAGMSKPYKNENADMDLVRKVSLSEGLMERHGTIMEHIVFTFDVLGSSRLELQEHMRHRIASPTVESTRFVLNKIVNELDNPLEANPWDYFVCPDLSETGWDADKKKRFLENYTAFSKVQLHGIKSVFEDFYEKKKDNDYLKYFLPENLRTNFTWTINLRSLVNFLKLRKAPGAHFEIRHIAGLIIEALKDHWVWPVIERGLRETE